MWQYVHLLPAEVIQAAIDLRTKQFLPMHWGMYNLSIHDWFDPIESVSTLAEKAKFQFAPSRKKIILLNRSAFNFQKPSFHFQSTCIAT